MNKILIMFVAMAFIALSFSTGAFAGGMDRSAGADKSMNSNAKTYNMETKDANAWIGKHVKNTQGEDLGKVKDFVRDNNGEISLAVISHGGLLGVGKKDVAVPFSALSFNKAGDHVVINATKDQMARAPEVKRGENLHDRTFAENVYRYFGVRPYWTDQGMKNEQGKTDQGMKSDKDAGSRGYFGGDRDSSAKSNPDAMDYNY